MAQAPRPDRPDRPVGVVLAAGRGRRFGGAKQLAELDGRPLVLHAVAPLTRAGLDVQVVVGHDADRVAAVLPREIDGQAVQVVVNPRPERGQGSSLATAARAAGPRPLVVVLGDQPGLADVDVGRVLAALDDGALAARIVHDDGPGHPVGFSGRLHDRLVELEQDGAARALLGEVGVVALRARAPRPPDVDTRDDLEALRATRGGGAAGHDDGASA